MQRLKKNILHIINHWSVVLRLFTGIKKAGWWSLCTLCLKGAEVLFEGLSRTAELQKSQVTMFPHLHVLLLLPPHSYYNLTNTPDNKRVCYTAASVTNRIIDFLPSLKIMYMWVCLTLALTVLMGSLSSETVRQKTTWSSNTRGGCRGCKQRTKCWHREGWITYNSIGSIRNNKRPANYS